MAEPNAWAGRVPAVPDDERLDKPAMILAGTQLSTLTGLLILDKPAGISSRDCVNHVQRVVGHKRLKIGHAGTLDPLATGVLLVALGEATKLVEHYHELDKRYIAQFEFGKSSDTLDREGAITEHPGCATPTAQELDSALPAWLGPQVLQRPPRYSAIKIQGQRAYDMARRGTEFEPEPRPVAIHGLHVSQYAYPHWTLNIHCGSGTYVRSLGRDLANQLGNFAIMNELVRTAIGPFGLDQATPLDQLPTLEAIQSKLLSPVAGLPHWHRVHITEAQAASLRQGQKITLHANQFDPNQAGPNQAGPGWLAIDPANQLVALLEVLANGYARPARVFNTSGAGQ